MECMVVKSSKPKIKVEEIVDDKAVTPEVKKEDLPKISSFSQLDADKTPETVMEDKPIDLVNKEGVSEKEPVVPEQEEAKVENISESQEKMSSDDVKEWLKDIRPDTTKEVEKGGKFNFKMFFIFLFIFALLGALIGGLYYYKQKVNGEPASNNEQGIEKETPTIEPTATPSASADLSKLKVNVLNGSGIKGEANKVKSLLKNGGFAEDKIETGNANSYDYKTTSVSLKKDVPEEVFSKVKELLGSGYDVVKAVGTVKDTSLFDVEIIVGKK